MIQRKKSLLWYYQHKEHAKSRMIQYNQENKEILYPKRKLYKRQSWSERKDNPKNTNPQMGIEK